MRLLSLWVVRFVPGPTQSCKAGNDGLMGFFLEPLRVTDHGAEGDQQHFRQVTQHTSVDSCTGQRVEEILDPQKWQR